MTGALKIIVICNNYDGTLTQTSSFKGWRELTSTENGCSVSGMSVALRREEGSAVPIKMIERSIAMIAETITSRNQSLGIYERTKHQLTKPTDRQTNVLLAN